MTEVPSPAASFAHLFRDPALCRLALTHSSTGAERDNERLEFLGDAVLDLVMAEELFHDPAHFSEGTMTELKARLVSRETLAAAARHMRLESAVSLGPGLQARALPRSVMANVYEALVGALYLDQGLESARRFVHESLRESLEEVHRDRGAGNPKQELQQLCQRRWGAPPDYAVLDQRGRAHSRAFLVAARTAERRFPSAWGRTRKEAERWAAHEALLVLRREGEE